MYCRIIDETTVTAENIEQVREMCTACDQAKALEPGCITWGFTGEGGQRGQMTTWPNGRAAIALGGDSLWGDYDPSNELMQVDDGCHYNRHGEEVCRHGHPLRAEADRPCGCEPEPAVGD